MSSAVSAISLEQVRPKLSVRLSPWWERYCAFPFFCPEVPTVNGKFMVAIGQPFTVILTWDGPDLYFIVTFPPDVPQVEKRFTVGHNSWVVIEDANVGDEFTFTVEAEAYGFGAITIYGVIRVV